MNVGNAGGSRHSPQLAVPVGTRIAQLQNLRHRVKLINVWQRKVCRLTCTGNEAGY